MQESRPFGA
jgi:hypothetical protein